MKRSLMAAAAFAAFALPAAAPVLAVAQDGAAQPDAQEYRGRPSQDPDRAPRRRGNDDGDSAPRASRPAAPAPAPERARAPDRPQRADRPDRSDNNGGRRPDRSDNGSAQQRPDRPNRPDRPGNGGDNRPDRPNRPDNNNGGWNRPDRPNSGWNRDRDRDRSDFRQRFNRDQWRRDWNRNHGRDWWRNDHRWRGYNGVRIGFYFAPNYGYYSVPRSYYNQRWSEGDYLPSIFWRYRLDDWRTYGLGYPPEGTRWVLVDNQIYLIDEYDGYIIDVIYDAWRW